MNRPAQPLLASSWLCPKRRWSWAACSGGAHGDDPESVGPGSIQDGRGLWLDLVILGVDLVLGWVIVLHRLEGVQSHVEGDEGRLNPHGPDLL